MTDEHPRYPALNQEIVEVAFPRVRGLVRADDWAAAFSELDNRAPRLTSDHPGHPDAVTYAFKLAPETGLNMLDGNVSVKIDVLGDDAAALTRLRRNVPRFREEGFDVELEGRRDTYEVVWDSWAVPAADVSDDETVRAVADRFADLVEVGHGVLVE